MRGIMDMGFEKGFVAVNPGREAETVEIPVNANEARIVDVFTGKTLIANNGRLGIVVSANAGRVYRSG